MQSKSVGSQAKRLAFRLRPRRSSSRLEDVDDRLGRIENTLSIFSSIRIVFFGHEAWSSSNVFKRLRWKTAVTSVIVEVLRTVHQLLLGHEMSLLSCGVDEETSLYIARSRESPARSTLALILDAAHCAKFAPVEKFWRCSRQFFL